MANPPRPLNSKQIERLNTAQTRTAIKWMSKAQTWLFKTTNGKLGNKFLRGAEVGILTTDRSDKTRRASGDSPLLFLQEGQRIVLVASQGGRATNPMWYLNLVANPRITFQTKAARGSSQADLHSTSTQRDSPTDRMSERDEYWPNRYDRQRDRTHRNFVRSSPRPAYTVAVRAKTDAGRIVGDLRPVGVTADNRPRPLRDGSPPCWPADEVSRARPPAPSPHRRHDLGP